MNATIKVINAKSLQSLLKKTGKTLAAESQRILEMQARALCIDYGYQTSPPDAFGEAAVEGYKKNIEKQVRYIYPTRSDTGKVFELIKQRDPVLANAYYYAVKTGQVNKAAALVRKAGVPQGGATPEGVKAARTGKGRSIPARTHPPVSLLRDSESRVIVRGQTNRIGTAKAGWHQAAKSISGGRVRRGTTTAAGTKTSLELFPKYVRAVSRRYNDLGGSIVGTGRIVIYSNVRHASEALPKDRMASAESDAQARILKAVQIMLSKITEKFNKTKAA
jgi:hypothetical protein